VVTPPDTHGSATPPADLIEVGRILSAHGVRGWFRVQAHSSAALALQKAERWWLSARQGTGDQPLPMRPLSIQAIRPTASSLLVQAHGITDRDTAEVLRGCRIWVSRARFPDPEPGEYYWVDLIGCLVFGQRGDDTVLLGQVDDVFDNGAHSVLQVTAGQIDAAGRFTPDLDARGRARQTLVPFVAAHIQDVDLAARRIDSNWPADF